MKAIWMFIGICTVTAGLATLNANGWIIFGLPLLLTVVATVWLIWPVLKPGREQGADQQQAQPSWWRSLPLKNLGQAMVVLAILGWLIVLTIERFQVAMVQERIWP